MTRELSKWLSLCAVVVFCLLDSAVSRAGTLDPRLTALAAGKMPVTRSVGSHGTSVPLSPFEPRLDSAGRVQVYIYPGVLGGLLPSVSELENLGAVQVRVSVPLRVIQAWVPIRALKALAALPDVGRVTVPTYAVTPHPPAPSGRQPVPKSQGVAPRPPTAQGVPTGLSIDLDAVQAMQANLLQAVNVQGAGIKVGVISDDNSGLAASQAAGYLPSSIFSDPTYPGTTPTPGDPAEGTAMLEEVHAMAPGASLGFCGPSTSVDFQTCYSDLVTWGANVIVDDLGFNVEDMFTTGTPADGSFAAAITQITQANPKMAFLSSAGNDAQDYFEAGYVAGPACSFNGTAYSSCMDFGKALGQSSANAIAVTINTTSPFTPQLEWNDPIGSSPDKLVLYLVNGSGTVLATGAAVTTSDGRPGEDLSYTAATAGETDYIEIACTTCTNPITIKIMGNGDGAVQFGALTPGSIDAGQKVAAGVLATVAAGVVSQSPLAVNLEGNSAIGPYLYGGYTGTSTLAKPDLTGIDGVTVSGAGGFSSSSPAPNGGVTFCGTSATGPNVGSLIAGLMSADPGQPAAFYYAALQNSASQTAVGTAPFTGCGTPTSTGYTSAGAGAGLAQGFAALKSFFTFPSTSITAPITVANGASGTITEPTNLVVDFTATVQAGTNTAAAANCQWNADGVLQTGVSVAYTFPSVGTYTIVANCPDSRGILSPTAPALTVNAQNIPAPTVTVSNTTQTNINLTLTGAQPLTVSATSSNNAVLPDTGITFSSGCGTTTLSCAVSLSPTAQANGSATVTITDTDQYGQKGSGNTQVSYTYTPPPPSSGGGGGGMNIFVLMALIGLIASKRGRTIITT